MEEIKFLEIPEFLSNNDEDDIHSEMYELIPDEYDKSEGQHLWNFTRPTAHIVSQLRGFDIPNALSLIWPQFSTGEYLDYHAELRNMTRKEAQYAKGYIKFTGESGTSIPKGYKCATESKNDIASKSYQTLEDCVIGDDGTVTVAAQATEPGMDGNAAANTIVINSTGYEGITAITNEMAFIGGINEEDDESLLERIQGYDRTQGDSNTGNPSDYKRWAEEVNGTGEAKVIRSTDTSGLVTIVLFDGNGNPASEELCTTVYNHIISPDDESQRIAPCGASLKVIPPQTLQIVISASVQLNKGSIDSVTTEYVNALKEYISDFVDNGEVLYQRIYGSLGDIEDVYDYSNVVVNGGQTNIILQSGVFPIIDAEHITLTLNE